MGQENQGEEFGAGDVGLAVAERLRGRRDGAALDVVPERGAGALDVRGLGESAKLEDAQ